MGDRRGPARVAALALVALRSGGPPGPPPVAPNPTTTGCGGVPVGHDTTPCMVGSGTPVRPRSAHFFREVGRCVEERWFERGRDRLYQARQCGRCRRWRCSLVALVIVRVGLCPITSPIVRLARWRATGFDDVRFAAAVQRLFGWLGVLVDRGPTMPDVDGDYRNA